MVLKAHIFKLLVGLAGVVLLLVSSESWATNGMNMIGYDGRSSAMGGADVALAADSSGAAGNPASMGISQRRSASVGLALLSPRLSLHDGSNNSLHGKSQLFPLPKMSYAQPVAQDSPLIVGLNLYAQGGMGVDFEGVNTFSGTVDRCDSKVSYLRFTGTVNYLVNDRLSIGLGVMGGYVDMSFSLFPNTYSVGLDGTAGTSDDFMGTDASGLSNYGMAGKVGVQYQLTPAIRLGLQYSSEAILDPNGGKMTLNYGARRVTYDAEVEGFTWPREVEAGLAVQATKRLLLAADLKWLNWSSAMEKIKVKGSNPDQSGVATNPVLTFNMNWRDQWVIALGAEYALTTRQYLRLGYNYGQSPVPDNNLTPIFPAIVEHHLTIGYSYNWPLAVLDLAYEHGFSHTQRNNNPGPPSDPSGISNPFGRGVEVSHRQDIFHLQLHYYF